MATKIEPVTPQQVLKMAQSLSPADQRWLAETIIRALDQMLLETQQLTLDEAIELYRSELITMSRAAELARVTIWDIQDALIERNIPLWGGSDETAEEMDDAIERFLAKQERGL